MLNVKLGLLPPIPAKDARALLVRLTGLVPVHPGGVDHLANVPRWVLGANNQFGTCGPTSVANYVVMVYRVLLGLDVTVTDAAVFDLYRRAGNPDFDPATGAGDRGVDMQTMLEAWTAGGIEVTHADGTTELVKPVAFAKVPKTLDGLQAAIAIFGGLLLAVDLEVAQQAQTDRGLWDYAPSSDWGGHAVMGGRYMPATAGGADIADVTWAKIVATTDAFIAHQLRQPWVAILPAHLTHPAFLAGVDLAALAADYHTLTDKTLPVPAPPTPAPGPTPGPTPDAIHALLAEVAGDLKTLARKIVAFLEHH